MVENYEINIEYSEKFFKLLETFLFRFFSFCILLSLREFLYYEEDVGKDAFS